MRQADFFNFELSRTCEPEQPVSRFRFIVYWWHQGAFFFFLRRQEIKEFRFLVNWDAHTQPHSVQMLSVAGCFSSKGYQNSHRYGGKPALCVQCCILVASLCEQLWAACYGEADILCCVATSPMKLMYLRCNSITSPGVSHRFEIENITDHLGRVIQLSVFGVVLFAGANT